MSKLRLSYGRPLWRVAIVCVVSVFVSYADVPRGWHLNGTRPAEYEAGVDAQAESLLSQAKTNYQLSLTALDHATGELIAHHHLTLIP